MSARLWWSLWLLVAGYCNADSDCGAYGAGACCRVPGPQVTEAVCLPIDAGICDAG